MTTLGEIVDRLRRIDEDDFLKEVSSLLKEDVNWRGLALSAVQSMTSVELFLLARNVRVAEVQPLIFPLHVEPGRFAVVLNHYVRSGFDALFERGRITPHYHHFSFCSRLLQGKFYHIEYANEGSLDRPRLTQAQQRWYEAGDVFDVPYPMYHCVLTPEDQTVSLMVRGKALFVNPHIGDPAFTLAKASSQKNAIERAIAGA